MANQLYLKTKTQTIPIDIIPTEEGLLIQGDKVEFKITGPWSMFKNLIAPLIPKRKEIDVLGMTPQDVITYFEQSPILNTYADDVRAALRTSVQESQDGPEINLQLQQDLKAIKHLNNPSKADISEILTGKRTYGGSVFERVTKAFEALNTTTSPEIEDIEPEEIRKAA